MQDTIKVLVTNASSRTLYSFLPRLCSGDVFGLNQRLELVLFDFKPLFEKVASLKEELLECCFPAIHSISATSNLSHAFYNVDVAILSELESDVIGFRNNAVLFRSYGIIINKHAFKNIKVLVCGRTANTSAFICSSFSPSVPPHNFTCLVHHLLHHTLFNYLSSPQQRNNASKKFNYNNDNTNINNNNNNNNNKGSDSGPLPSVELQPKVHCRALEDFMRNHHSLLHDNNNIYNNNNNNNIRNNNNIHDNNNIYNNTNNNNIRNNNNIHSNSDNSNNNEDSSSSSLQSGGEGMLVWGDCSSPIISSHDHAFQAQVTKEGPGPLVTAKSIAEHLRFWLTDCPQKEVMSMGVVSRRSAYDIDNNIFFNVPVVKKVHGNKQPHHNSSSSSNNNNNNNNNINSDCEKRVSDGVTGVSRTSMPHSASEARSSSSGGLASASTVSHCQLLTTTSNLATVTLETLNMTLTEQLHQLLQQASKQLCQQRDDAIIDCWRIVLPHSHL